MFLSMTDFHFLFLLLLFQELLPAACLPPQLFGPIQDPLELPLGVLLTCPSSLKSQNTVPRGSLLFPSTWSPGVFSLKRCCTCTRSSMSLCLLPWLSVDSSLHSTSRCTSEPTETNSGLLLLSSCSVEPDKQLRKG